MLAAPHRNHALLTEIVYGVLRHSRELQWYLHTCSNHPPKPLAQSILYTGLYQLLYLNHREEFAVVHETVQSAVHLGNPKLKGFINAILRRVLRERDALSNGLAKQSFAVRVSHPDHLISRWEQRFGKHDTERLCMLNNQRPMTVLRVAQNRISLEKLQEHLYHANIGFTPHPVRPKECLILTRGLAVQDVPGFTEGWFIVQDPATLSAVDLLDVQPGETVLDLCASPGGKTIAIAERMHKKKRRSTGTLLATDLHADRMPRLKENLTRMHATDVLLDQANAADPTELVSLLDRHNLSTVEKILLDVPCSNTGVIRRRPEVRYRVTQARLQQLCRNQRAILDSAASILRPHGRIVYSTCSIEIEENEGLIDHWLTDHPEFKKIQDKFMFPPNTQTDGAYVCVLEQQSVSNLNNSSFFGSIPFE